MRLFKDNNITTYIEVTHLDDDLVMGKMHVGFAFQSPYRKGEIQTYKLDQKEKRWIKRMHKWEPYEEAVYIESVIRAGTIPNVGVV